MGVSSHSEEARAGADSLVGIRSIGGKTVCPKHAFGRSPKGNQTKTEKMKTVDKKNPMGAVKSAANISRVPN